MGYELETEKSLKSVLNLPKEDTGLDGWRAGGGGGLKGAARQPVGT